jgi:hypothetical protein
LTISPCGRLHHRGELRLGQIGGVSGVGVGPARRRSASSMRSCAAARGRRGGGRPDRRDDEKLVAQPVEDQNEARAHEEHVGQVEIAAPGGAASTRPKVSAEIADQTGQRRRQGRGHIDMAGRHQSAQFGQRILASGSNASRSCCQCG